MPAANFNTRAYYYWTKLDNKSDLVEFGNAPTTPLASGLGCGNLVVNGIPTQTVGNCENELYNYTKNNVGFDAWWKFAPGQRLGFGYDYLNIDQTRVDYDKSHSNKLWAEYKNTMFDTLTGRLKYQYMKRDSTLNFSNDPLPNGGANNPNYLLPFTSAFDLQSNTTNLVKLTLDWNPMMNVGLSFEGNWAKVDFDDVTYGRTKSDRQGYFLSGYWNASNTVKLNAFGSWEEAKYPSNHRYIGTVAGGPNPPSGYCTAANPNCYDPFAPPSRQQLLQLELADQGQDVDVRRGRRLAGDGRAQADGVVPVHLERGHRDVRRAEQHRDHADAASHQQLRQQQAAVHQPEGRLELQPELVVHRRLLVPASTATTTSPPTVTRTRCRSSRTAARAASSRTTRRALRSATSTATTRSRTVTRTSSTCR